MDWATIGTIWGGIAGMLLVAHAVSLMTSNAVVLKAIAQLREWIIQNFCMNSTCKAMMQDHERRLERVEAVTYRPVDAKSDHGHKPC
jgi:hypothetical protein